MAQYNSGRKGGSKIVCTQELDTIGLWSFAWKPLAELADELMEKQLFWEKERQVGDKYIDGDKAKTVKFNEIYLRQCWEDDHGVYRLMGERELTDTELAAYQKQEAEKEEERKKERQKE